MSFSSTGASATGARVRYAYADFGMFQVGGVVLVSGWWRPTTLTAADCYWASSASTSAHRLRIATTTSELEFVSARTTTNRTVVSTDASIAANEWYFICLVSHNRADNAQQETFMWLGTPTSPPRALTLSVTTAGSGNVVEGTDIFLMSSAATTDLLAGQVSQVFTMYTAGNYLGGTTSDTLSSTFVYERFVHPLWLGRFDLLMMTQNMQWNSSSPTKYWMARWIPLDQVSNNGTANTFISYRVTSYTATPSYVMEESAAMSTVSPEFSELEPPAPRITPVSLSRMPLNHAIARR